MKNNKLKQEPGISHTPGPWIVDRCMIEGQGKSIGEVYNNAIYKAPIPEMIIPEEMEGLANARLIAAAPELLEACKDAKRQIEMMVERMPLNKMAASDSIMISFLVNVIAKAEGN